MLNRFSVKGRMYLIIGAILALFLVMVFFAVQNGYKVRDLGLHKTGDVMLADQKAKLQVSSHAMALAMVKVETAAWKRIWLRTNSEVSSAKSRSRIDDSVAVRFSMADSQPKVSSETGCMT